MLVFPQLMTGASALYPVTKTSVQRTVVNTLGDGSTVLFPIRMRRHSRGSCTRRA